MPSFRTGLRLLSGSQNFIDRAVRQSGKIFFVLGGCFLLNSCVSGVSAETLQKRLASFTQSSVKIKSSPRFAFAGLRLGQWASYRIQSLKGPSIYTLKVIAIGETTGSFWLEEQLESVDAPNRVAKSLWILDESRALSASQQKDFEVTLMDLGKSVRAFVKPPLDDTKGDSQELVGQLPLILLRPSFLGSLKLGKNRKRMTKAGSFAGCFQGHTLPVLTLPEADAGKGTQSNQKFSGCFDSQVPLWGIVDAVDASGGVWELLAFGFSGAKSDF